MKRNAIIILAILVLIVQFSLSSCGSETVNTENDIFVGTWYNPDSMLTTGEVHIEIKENGKCALCNDKAPYNYTVEDDQLIIFSKKKENYAEKYNIVHEDDRILLKHEMGFLLTNDYEYAMELYNEEYGW